MKAGRHLARLSQPVDLGLRPWSAEPQRLWWRAIEVAHFSGQGFIAGIEGSGKLRSKDAEVFLGRKDLHRRVHVQQMIQSAHMVAVSMRHDDEVQFAEIDSFDLDVV